MPWLAAQMLCVLNPFQAVEFVRQIDIDVIVEVVGSLHRFHQIIHFHGLAHEVERAVLHGSHSHGDVRVT